MSLAFVLGAGLLTAPISMVSQADYLVERAQYTIVTPQPDQSLSAQFPQLANQMIELNGVIIGVTSGTTQDGPYAGYVLKLPDGQIMTMAADLRDPDIRIGNTLRVLARVPADGTVLTEMAEMRTKIVSNKAAAVGASQSPLDRQFAQPDPPAGFLAQLLPATHPTAQPAAKDMPGGKTAMQTRQTPKTVVPGKAQKAAIPSKKVRLYAAKIQQVNGNISEAVATKIAQRMLEKSEQYGVDPRLVFALVTQESGFNPHAVSPVGAQGLGQLMPATARSLGVKDAFDITDNLDGTVHYLSGLMDTFHGNSQSALAAYNAGPGNVQRYGGVPPFPETQNYVQTISAHYRQLKNSPLQS